MEVQRSGQNEAEEQSNDLKDVHAQSLNKLDNLHTRDKKVWDLKVTELARQAKGGRAAAPSPEAKGDMRKPRAAG